MRTLLFLSLSLGLVACGDDDGDRPRDSGTGTDTGTPIVPDGGGTDTGVPVPDGGGGGTDSGMMTGMCPAGACNIESGAGCPAGEGCYYGSMEAGGTPAPLCAPAGTGMSGATCDAINDCREGHICVEGPGGAGECRQVCCGGSTAACAVGDVCIGVNGSTDVGVCETPAGCNVIDQTGCSGGLDCVLLMGDGSTACRDLPEGGGTQGDACGDGVTCAAGFLCLRTSEAMPFSCLRACNPAMDMCAEGLTCARLTDSLGGCAAEG